MTPDRRACTCHPSEAPQPCQHRYAYSECRRAALVHRARMIIMDGLHDAMGLQLSDVDAAFALIRAEVLEEAARVAEITPQQFVVVGMRCEVVDNSKTIATAIRALKGDNDGR